jgi:cysteine-rich repeat protein
MRASIAVVILIAGCAANTDPCNGKTGTCIGLHVVGSIAKLDQLAFTLQANTKVERTPNPPANMTLPVKVALFPPAGTTGTVHISADAFDAGKIVGHGEADATLVGGRAQQTLTLSPSSGGDMATHDLAGADLAGTADLAACNTVAQCMSGDGCCPSGCNNSTDTDCPSLCGNGVVETGEACDDGNSTNGDGCDPTCQWTGTMTTISGVAGSSSYADGPDVRFGGYSSGGGFGALATDGTTLYIFDVGTSTMRAWPLDGHSTPTTLFGSAYNASISDGAFNGARIGAANTAVAMALVGTTLYFTDKLPGGSYELRAADLKAKTVAAISSTQNVSSTLSTDGTTLFYLDTSGNLVKWTPGDASSTQLVSAGTIGRSCSSLLRASGLTYLGCAGAILQVTDAGAVTVYAGTGTATSTCSDATTATNATFVSQIMGLAMNGTTLVVSSCAALRQIDNMGVRAFAGMLNMPGYNFFGAYTGGGAPPDAMPFVTISNSFYVGDSQNASIKVVGSPVSSPSTVAGSSPLVNATDVRGDKLNTRYALPMDQERIGIVTDGTQAYLLSGSKLIAVDLMSGGSKDLFDFGFTNTTVGYGNAITRIGSTLYVALPTGVIHSIGVDGTNDAIFAGDGSRMPPSDGVVGNLQTAVLDPIAITTDGTNLYFLDYARLVRKIDIAASKIATIAGTASSNDIADGTGANAHFEHPADLVYANAKLYTVDGPVACCVGGIREISLATGVVKLIAGSYLTGPGPGLLNADADGNAGNAQLAAGQHLTTDGQSLFIADASLLRVYQGITLAPTIRQLDLATSQLSTFVGTRGQWTIHNDVGSKALVNDPGPITFDTATHSLVFVDMAEGVIQRTK